VRQAFVAEPLAYSAASEPLRSYRAPFVGFDFLDVAAPPPPAAAKAELPPEPPARQAAASAAGQAEAPTDRVPEPQIVPPAPGEETAALPAPAQDADLAALVRRGDALLRAGDIVAARSAYERAAAGGSAKAQIGVGKTYDPLVLAKLGARGVRGDPVEAASWYARAGEAGDEEGQQRLHALISGLSDCILAQGACSRRRP
jgi:TPR repeat protein